MADIIENFAAGRRMKVYFVELDDEDRERVISGTVENMSIDLETVTPDFKFGQFTINSWSMIERATMTFNLVPSEDGTLFRIENFMEQRDCELEDEDE